MAHPSTPPAASSPRARLGTVRVASAAAIVVSLLVIGYLFWGAPESSMDIAALRGDRQMSVVLVTLDTTRADRIGAYGYEEINTPAFDGLAATGVTFLRAYSPTPLTLPAHTSLMTGTYPPYHGVRDNGAFVASNELVTLAEQFQQAGYRTGAFIGAFVLDGRFGLEQGFDSYFDEFEVPRSRMIPLASIQRTASEVVDAAIEWAEQDSSAPFFMWVHMYDAHTPYEPPAEFEERYPERPYIGEIAYADSQLGRLVSWLDVNGLRDDTFVVVSADHGESLGEHGEIEHGLFLYEAAIRVPLVVSVPFSAYHGIRRPEPVSLVDVMPTILGLTGLPIPAAVQSENLVPWLGADDPDRSASYVYSETYYPRLHFGWSELRAILNPEYKLIVASSETELYDLDEDPEEIANLSPQRAATAEALRIDVESLVASFEEDGGLAEAVTLDEETRRRLAALGYLGNFAASVEDDSEVRVSPVEKIEIYNDLLRARAMTLRTELAEAESLFRGIIAADPGVIDAYQALGNLLTDQGRYSEAIPIFEEAVAHKPEDVGLVLFLANAQVRSGNAADAERLLTDFADVLDPDARLYMTLGGIYQRSKRPQEALDAFNRALTIDAEMASAHVGMASAYLQLGRLDLAESSLARAAAVNDELSELNFTQAELYQRQGRLNDAITSYQRELEVSPEHLMAAFNLSLLYRITENLEQEERYLRLALSIDPAFPRARLFMARIHLVRRQDFEAAIQLVEGALTASGVPPQDRALGHFLLADIYNRLGRAELSRQHARLGQRARATIGS